MDHNHRTRRNWKIVDFVGIEDPSGNLCTKRLEYHCVPWIVSYCSAILFSFVADFRGQSDPAYFKCD